MKGYCPKTLLMQRSSLFKSKLYFSNKDRFLKADVTLATKKHVCSVQVLFSNKSHQSGNILLDFIFHDCHQGFFCLQKSGHINAFVVESEKCRGNALRSVYKNSHRVVAAFCFQQNSNDSQHETNVHEIVINWQLKLAKTIVRSDLPDSS